jgi:poly-gamma-glutamate capsule biosynthesis protein CapA/YwtB (metallophosphatase superfamily)
VAGGVHQGPDRGAGVVGAGAGAADKARAAAVKAVGGGTAGAVTTDVSGNGYEVTVTKSDGSKVEVHLDQSFNLDDHGRLGG